MSGMASYGKVHNDDEIWNVVAFVQRLPKMTPEEYGRLEKEARCLRPHLIAFCIRLMVTQGEMVRRSQGGRWNSATASR